MYSGVPITLEQLLGSREQRAFRQRVWLENHALPLISFTINMVGEVKVNALAKVAFKQGISAILECCEQSTFSLKETKITEQNTGLEFLAAAENTTSLHLKSLMVSIEDTHPLGRLFDIDIIDINGHALSRDSMSMDRRQCIVCSNDAKICSRSRRHSKQLIIEKMTEMVRSTL
ncbi:citrate lyase holo-[acyl-carrier protein] synthase [Vibrio algarum]|uniref:citrate lyase holo-[acyl-carrier protein] synthase n=1 Tax=Vibrio algarum TaxID=3020714 RepID=A0ABT4YX40_9VIBR|nr:citrate lyase holo-[acyl-carrier protein] synthase [Vibrio sp. KJ40-1]MDB1126157.1 citrate lyase holo-[acyl-carrier protein] synthase [Vibrio sp. KJ40-1]